MKIRNKLLMTCVTGALVIGAGPLISNALAQSAKAMNAAEPVPFWWFHGELEAGGRVFLNNPEKNGTASQGGKSLAKYYEYNALKPGPFLNGHLSTGTNDGLYQIDLWAKNAGYDDQRFNLDASKAGQQYFNFEWDQTPHNYGSGLTLYNGVGTNTLTLPAGLAATLHGVCTNTATCANPALAQRIINANVHQTDLGIRRDTATVDYRWTPDTAWDVRVNYMNMYRTGSQVDGIVFGPNTSAVGTAQVPKPVNDTTQNYGINGEYAGTSPWGKNFTFKLGYGGSTYTDKDSSYTVDDPFCPAGVGLCGPGGGLGVGNGGNNYASSALVSLWPSNQANGFNATLGADLPWKSRYAGTVSYTMMRQNEAFLPFTNNPAPRLGAQPSPVLPASSLNGAINTLLVNNVLTTQITSDLKSKLSYRYYDYANDTPELLFQDYILTDTVSANNRNSGFAPVRSISVSYTKQNAGADLNWRPTHNWNLGTAYGYERYDWTRADVDVTNENSGKVYADWKPMTWVTARASWLYSDRRYQNYDYVGNVGAFQWPDGAGTTQYSTAMRQFYLNKRDRNKGQFSVAVDVIRGLTITPTFGYLDDVYQVDNPNVGLTRNQSWRGGVELAYALNPGTTFLFSYMNEQSHKNLHASTTATVPSPAASTYDTEIKETVNTFMGMVNYAAIPDKLDLKLSYTVSLANDSQPVNWAVFPTDFTQYPDVRTTWQRLEAVAKYTFDKDTVRQLGWKGEVSAKLRYAWERNSVDNWQNDNMQTYMFTAAAPGSSYSYMTWLAYNNPNYDVHLIGASLAFKW